MISMVVSGSGQLIESGSGQLIGSGSYQKGSDPTGFATLPVGHI